MNGSTRNKSSPLRSPLRDFTNQMLSGVGDSKSVKKVSISSGRGPSQLDSSIDNDIRKIERSDKEDTSYQDTTPTRGGGGGGDSDLESESTGEEYESAGETSPSRRDEKKPLNVTILAETLAAVHLSTPPSSTIRTVRQLTTFPFSPIVASDVSPSDEDTTCSFSAQQSGFKKDLSSVFEEGSITLGREDCSSPGDRTLHECSKSLTKETTPNKKAARVPLNPDILETDEQISHPEESSSKKDSNRSCTEGDYQSSSDKTLPAWDSSSLVVECSTIAQSLNTTSRESLKSVCLDELEKLVEGDERKNRETGRSEALLRSVHLEEAIPDKELKKSFEEEKTENLFQTYIHGKESKETCISQILQSVRVDVAVHKDELKKDVEKEEGRTENISQQEIRQEESNETVRNAASSLSELHITSKSLSLAADGSSDAVNDNICIRRSLNRITDLEEVIPDGKLKKEGTISEKDICEETPILSECLNAPSLLVEDSNDAVNKNIHVSSLTGVEVEEAIPEDELKKSFEEEKNICDEKLEETLKFTLSELHNIHPRSPSSVALGSNGAVNHNFCVRRNSKGVDKEAIPDEELEKNVEEEERSKNLSHRDICEDDSNETLKFAESSLSVLHNTTKSLVDEDSTIEANEKSISLRRSLKSVKVEEAIPVGQLKIRIEGEEEVEPKESLKPSELYEADLNEPWTPKSFSSIRVETGSCPSVASTPDHRLNTSAAGDTPGSTPSGKVHCGKKSLDFSDIVSPHHKRRQSLSTLQGDIEGSPNKRVALDQDLETTDVPKSDIQWSDIETYKSNSHFGKDLSPRENAQGSIVAEKEVSKDYRRPLTLEIPSVELRHSQEDERFIVRTPEVIKSIADDLICPTDNPAAIPESIESHRFLVRTPEVISSIEENNSSPVISTVEKNFFNGEEIIVSNLPGETKDQSCTSSDKTLSVEPDETFIKGSSDVIVNGETCSTQNDTELSNDGIEKLIESYLILEELSQNNSEPEEFVEVDESKFTIVEIGIDGLTPNDFFKETAVYESATEFSSNVETYAPKVEEYLIDVEKTSVNTTEELKNLTVVQPVEHGDEIDEEIVRENCLKDVVKSSSLSAIEQSIDKDSSEIELEELSTQLKTAAEILIGKGEKVDNIGQTEIAHLKILRSEEDKLEETGVDRVGNVTDTDSPVEQQVEVVTEGSHSKEKSGVDCLVEAASPVDTGQRYNQQIVLGNNSVIEEVIQEEHDSNIVSEERSRSTTKPFSRPGLEQLKSVIRLYNNELLQSGSVQIENEVTPESHGNKSNSLKISGGAIPRISSVRNLLDNSSLIKFSPSPLKTESSNRKMKSSPKSIPMPSGGKKGSPSPLMIRSSERSPHEPGKLSTMESLQESINKLDDLTKLSDERKSYEDLLDRCSEQERLLGFDDTLREEADKLIQELANASSEGIDDEEDLDGAAALPSSAYQPCDGSFTSDLNRSEAGPVTADQDFTPKDGGFQEASSFDFDYLSQVGGKKGARNLTRESLFLIFDPLVANLTPVGSRMRQTDSDASLAATTPGLSSSASEDKLVSLTPAPGASSTLEMSPLSTIPNCSPSPQTPRSKAPPSSVGSVTPTLRHEILSKEISKLQDLMLQQDLVYQEQLQAQTEEVEELRARLAELETKRDQGDVEDRLIQSESRVRGMEKELAECAASRKEFRMILEEYEKMCLQFLSTRDEERKKAEVEIATITKEREEALQHLQNMEIAFNDIHLKYEKCKEAIEFFKKNEEEYKRCNEANEDTIKKQEEKYNLLKEHATQKFEEANTELTEMRKAHQAELAKRTAMQRKRDIMCKSLEESLAQKTREVEELSKICDELIKKAERR